MNFKRFQYRITVHSLEEILERARDLGYSPNQPAPVIFCDTQGRCMFDSDARDPYLSAIESILNDQAGKGRRLVQAVFRERQMTAIWEEHMEEEA